MSEVFSSSKIWAYLRITMGLIFLWSFIDKTFGLGFATCANDDIACSSAWVSGGSPTTGFLNNVVSGPFEGLYHSLAGLVWVDWLFMIGLLGVGLALTLGVGIKIATASGILLLAMLYFATWPPTNNPIIDEHIVYILVLAGLYKTNAQDTFGFGQKWRQTSLVKKYGFLR